MIKLLASIWHRLFNSIWNPKSVPLCTLCGRKMQRIEYGYQGILMGIESAWGCYRCVLSKTFTKR